MKLVSTRSRAGAATWTFEEALFQGLAPDGGLFMPVAIEPLPPASLDALRGRPLQDTGVVLAKHLLGPECKSPLVEEVVRTALDFPMPLVELGPGEYVLELFHGPTLAFKDVGARFMAGMMAALRPSGPDITVLVATSGDTGGAVADAFFQLPRVRVVVLFPKGKVSARQESQFTTLGNNISAVRVDGGFDECQQLVKEAFADPELKARFSLTSANSINIGRLIPQAIYYGHAWASLPERVDQLVVSVPSGNFGNLTAGLLARAMGVPIHTFVAATNANRVVPDYLETGAFRPGPSVPTLSSAMDVGNPSNFERIRHLFGDDLVRIRQVISGSAWSDEDARSCIQGVFRATGRIMDPHSAVGLLGLRRVLAGRQGATGVALATAHPAKFAEIVEPLIGEALSIPPALERSMQTPGSAVEIVPKLASLSEVLAELSP